MTKKYRKTLIADLRSTWILPTKALEKLSKDGYAPSLLNDDNGHWAVKFDSYQTVPLSEDPADVSITTYIMADEWKDTIIEALIYALKD